jgi:hypothetical protein
MTTSIEELRNQMLVAELEFKTTIGILRRLQDEKNAAEHAINQLSLIKEAIKFEKKQLRKAEAQELKLSNALDAAEAKHYVKLMNEKEKSGHKLKKGQFSEPILTKVGRLPEETVRIIKEYLPINVINKVLYATLAARFVSSRKKQNIHPEMKQAFLHYICNQYESLRFLSIKQAKSLVEEMSLYRFTNYSSQTELKNKLFMMIGMAMEKNAAFAYKMLKTFVVLGKPKL